MNIDTFNPKRLVLARARRCLTQKGLADKVGLTPRMVSMYENSHTIPPHHTLEEIASVLQYPIDFFGGDDIEELDAGSVSFRSMTKMKAVQRESALSAGRLALHLNSWLNSRFELPTASLPDLRDVDPETAACVVRERWGIGERSIKNMIHLLEAKGCRVFSLTENNREVDAFSFWKEDVPFIFLNTLKSAERSRFDAAHELGHLVLHKHGAPQGREVECQADRFASAFLMPESSVLARAPRLATLNHLIELKQVWKVSVAALVRRLKDVGALTEWHYRTLNIEMSKLGMLKKEPKEIARETSQVIDKIFKILRQDGISKNNIAQELNIPVDEINTLVFNLVLTSLSSSKKSKIIYKKDKRPSLTLVN